MVTAVCLQAAGERCQRVEIYVRDPCGGLAAAVRWLLLGDVQNLQLARTL